MGLREQDLERSPSENRIWCILTLKTSGGIKFTNFSENQLTTVYVVFLLVFLFILHSRKLI